MKPFTIDRLKDAAESIELIRGRAEMLHSLCGSMRNTADIGGTNDKDTIRQIYNLLSIMDDEIEYLEQEIESASLLASSGR